MLVCYNNFMNNDLGILLLDIGGLNEMPVDRGMTVRRRKDGTLALSIGDNDMIAGIKLTDKEEALLRDILNMGRAK